MGNLIFPKKEDDDEEEDQKELERWRPASDQNQFSNQRRRRGASDKGSDSESEGGSGSQGADSQSVSSSASKMDSEDRSDAGSVKGEEEEKAGSEGSQEREVESSLDGSEKEREDEALQKKDNLRNRKRVVNMEFEPLLEKHDPLGLTLEEPADIIAASAKKSWAKNNQALLDQSKAAERRRARAAGAWMLSNDLDSCLLREMAVAVQEDADELRYILISSGYFEVDEDSGKVTKQLLAKIFDLMENDIETFKEVLDKLPAEVDEEELRKAVEDSEGELRMKYANEIELIEKVDLEVEERLAREEEKEERQKAREERKKKKKGRRANNAEEEEDSEDDSDDDGGNKAAEKKALAFRRVQVQRKIEEFLKAYTRGQNLIKINAKGKRYHRRIYVDSAKRSLVVQGASGPKLFPFAAMKEVDIETRTTKEGRVETLVICAIEKGGRIVKELNLAFPDQAKANTFVNCVTLFSLALRAAPKGR